MAAEMADTTKLVLVKTPISSLNSCVLEELGMFLNPRLPLKDIRTFAGKLGYSIQRLRNFEREQNPTFSVLEDWSTSYDEKGEKRTVSDVLDKLEEMRRHDAVEFLKPYEFTVPDKVALVIGNKKYDQKKLNQLMYPENDAREIAEALHELGFKVVSLVNLTLSEMRIAVRSFYRLIGRGVYAVLYYAGHGYEDNGKNYLIPVDADVTFKRSDSLCAQEILQCMQECNASLNLLIIDACRVRPPVNEKIPTFFRRHGTNSSNNIVAYSCCSQQVAYEEGDQKNGVYAQHLLQHIKRDVRIENMLMDVATDVALTIRYCNNERINQRPSHESDAYIDCRLTDSIVSGVLPDEYNERLKLLQTIHNLPKPFVALENENLVLEVKFKKWSCNVMDLLMVVTNKTCYPMKDYVMDLDVTESPVCSDVTMVTGDEVKAHGQLIQIVRLTALQKLKSGTGGFPVVDLHPPKSPKTTKKPRFC